MNKDWHYMNVITNEYRDHEWIDNGRNDERIYRTYHRRFTALQPILTDVTITYRSQSLQQI